MKREVSFQWPQAWNTKFPFGIPAVRAGGTWCFLKTTPGNSFTFHTVIPKLINGFPKFLVLHEAENLLFKTAPPSFLNSSCQERYRRFLMETNSESRPPLESRYEPVTRFECVRWINRAKWSNQSKFWRSFSNAKGDISSWSGYPWIELCHFAVELRPSYKRVSAL